MGRKKGKLEKKLGYDVNDVCKNIYICRNAEWEFRCFGRYKGCVRYKTGDLTRPVSGYAQWERKRSAEEIKLDEQYKSE